MQIFANANFSLTRQNLLRSSLMEGELVMNSKTVYNRKVLMTYSEKTKTYPDEAVITLVKDLNLI